MSVDVDLDALAEAFADASSVLEYYVDRESGEVILVSESLGFIEAGEQRFEMSLRPQRYARVPGATEADLIDDLESFLEGVSAADLAGRLEAVLDEHDVPKALDKVLAKRVDIATAFAAHRSIRFRARAARWLGEQGLRSS